MRGQRESSLISRLNPHYSFPMATELFSLWGLQTGWRSEGGEVRFQVSATLDGISIWYRAPTVALVEQAFFRACRRTFLRRYLPWLAPPPSELLYSASKQAPNK